MAIAEQKQAVETMENSNMQEFEHPQYHHLRTKEVTADPLTWPFWLKIGITVNICTNAFLNNVNSAGMVPTLGPVAAEMGIPITRAANVIAYNVLAQGLGNMVWVPTMTCFGKRWTILGTSLLFIPCIAWCATAKSYESLLAARVLSGFAAGASETFAPVIIGDIWYDHSLTTALGFFTLSLLAGVGIGQTSLGYVTQGVGWHWAYWITFIAACINFVSMVVYLPETTFQRGLTVGMTAGDVERTEIILEDSSLDSSKTLSQVQPTGAEISTEPFSMKKNLWFIRHAHVQYKTNWFRTFLRPFQFFLSPTVLWSSLTYSVAAGSFTAVGVCIPQLTQPPPYNFNSGAQGLFGLSALVGVFLGGTIGSKVVDMYSSRVEKRRFRLGQDHKPEDKLVMLVIPFCTVTTGLVMYGVTIEKGLSWIVPSVGYAMHAGGFAVLGSITYSYTVDSYLVRSGEALVFNNMIRALISFGFSEFTPNLLVKVGAGAAYSILAAIVWGLLLAGIPMYVFGPRFRAATNRFL